jgi:hypothetical protein
MIHGGNNPGDQSLWTEGIASSLYVGNKLNKCEHGELFKILVGGGIYILKG